jgi:hypothetical protein
MHHMLSSIAFETWFEIALWRSVLRLVLMNPTSILTLFCFLFFYLLFLESIPLQAPAGNLQIDVS